MAEIIRRTTAEQNAVQLAGRFLRWCARAYSAASEADVIATLDERMIADIARDTAIAPGELVRLARAGPDSADEMLALMRRLGIDPVEALLHHPALFRDMQLRCGTCSAKARCRRDLRDGTADRRFRRYCGNGDDLNAMRAEPDLLLE